ncbi:chromosome segregation protein SMC [Asaia siamensis]
MSAKITRLRIAGFKSFADPATIDILPGLTGIVGPNGCGKSNVVEALRWAMGESSARALRGGELDDLIFAGTSARSARSLAEVTLWLEEATGLAPAPFAEADGLEICRRAERGSGSDFRLNGRALRARDITTLFADLSSGARSSSIVSQNRVSALISAKPEERRSLLEEAAGITGLHARRHDAELKLRQAESNMERSEDLRQQIESRLEQLEAQSTHARTYRNLSESIRNDEQALSWVTYRRAELLVERTTALLQAAEKERDESAAAASMAEQERTGQKARILELREQVETLREARNRLRVAAETTREALAQALNTAEQNAQRQVQLHADQQIAQSRLAEAQARHAGLTEAMAELETLLTGFPERLTELTQTAQESAASLVASEKTRQTLSDRLISERLAAQSLQAEHETTARRIAALSEEEQQLAKALDEVKSRLPDEASLSALQTTLDEKRRQRSALEEETARLTRAQQDARLALSQTEQETDQAVRDAEQARETLSRLETRLQALEAQCTRHETELQSLTQACLSEAELLELETTAARLLAARDKARQEAEQARAMVSQHQQALSHAEAEAQGVARQRSLLQREYEQAREAQARHESQIKALSAQRCELVAQMPAAEALEAAQTAHAQAQTTVSTLTAQSETLSAERNLSRQQHEMQEKARRETAASVLALRARREALAATHQAEALLSPLIDSLIIPPGLERAIASALDATLDASLDENQDRAWAQLPPLAAQPLPQPALSLLSLVDCPPALQRCFASIGLVDSVEAGATLHQSLSPGQCLVSREGALWRWDGYREAANLPSNALSRVEHLNAIRALEAEIEQKERALAPLTEHVTALEQKERSQTEQLAELRETLHLQEAALTAKRHDETILLTQRDRISSQLDRLDQTREEAAIQRDEMARRVVSAREALGSLAAESTLKTQIDSLRDTLANTRQIADRALNDARRLESDHGAAQEKATRLRLQEESNATRSRTLTAVLAQARQDLAEIVSQKTQIAQIDHDAALTRCAEARDRQRAVLKDFDARLNASRQALETLGREIGATGRDLQTRRDLKLSLTSRLSALLPQHDSVKKARAQAEAQQRDLAPVPDLIPLEQDFQNAQVQEAAHREESARHQEALREAEAAHDRAKQEKTQLSVRLSENNTQSLALKDDLTRLQARVALGETECARSDAEKIRLEAASQESIGALETAEEAFAGAAASLADIESALETLAETRRDAEQRCASARENTIRLQERLTQACGQLEKLTESRETAPPEDFDLPLTEQSETTLKRRLSRALKEREALGPVNLLADEEYNEARNQSDHLMREHEELGSAIGRLRGSINMLKKEGRERLQAVFVEVDRHFQSLFSRMFNGGKAHLGLVGSDDPLEAGLEIFAQPPGKKLSTLSLLSGGEQALTALSLIFATFRCQPAPLCILDEVDAPLDDANVERLCGLLKDMAEEADTRFLIVTHHQLTMAHMDRLFGVTMQERGVSQVLSVDLSLATSFAETGSLAVVS